MTILGVILAAVLTFNAEPPGRLPHNDIAPISGSVVIEGFTFTPTNENVWVLPDTSELDDRPWMYTSPWLGFTGNSPATFTVTYGGLFNLFGFDSIGLQTAPGRLVGSGGQVLDYQTIRHVATHYEVDWRNLEWIRFEHDLPNTIHCCGPNGFDNLIVEPVPDCTGGGWTGPSCTTVSEPGTAVLTGIAGLLLFGFSRKLGLQ